MKESARDVVDADGALVTPGFFDLHTHYDGQVTWDDALEPSASNGVSTVVLGNCGVGFAPVRPSDHAELIDMMEGVEDIPGTALADGIPWGDMGDVPRVPRRGRRRTTRPTSCVTFRTGHCATTSWVSAPTTTRTPLPTTWTRCHRSSPRRWLRVPPGSRPTATRSTSPETGASFPARSPRTKS